MRKEYRIGRLVVIGFDPIPVRGERTHAHFVHVTEEGAFRASDISTDIKRFRPLYHNTGVL